MQNWWADETGGVVNPFPEPLKLSVSLHHTNIEYKNNENVILNVKKFTEP